MKKTLLSLSLTAAAAVATLPSMALAMGAQDALNVITQNHHVATHGLQKQHGYWTAEAIANDGQRATVLVKDSDASFTAVRKSDIGTTLPGVAQVAQALRAAGWAHVHDLELDDGFWQAEARQSLVHGEKVELVLHPQTLEVLSQVGRSGGFANQQAVLGAEQIRLALQQAGYTRVHDLDYDDGHWEAEATNLAGQSVELRLDPHTAQVLSERLDD